MTKNAPVFDQNDTISGIYSRWRKFQAHKIQKSWAFQDIFLENEAFSQKNEDIEDKFLRN